MANIKTFMKSGHPPTLLAAFLYFDFSFAIWVLNGAMAPFITKSYHLTPQQAAFMISLPTLAGALMRFPLGVMSQYIGRKNAALVEMFCIMVAMAYGYFRVHSYNDVLAMGVLLGIAGASFGVALALGSGWFPPESKGLAMGIAGAGNSGTAIATFFAPMLAKSYGWQTVYGFAGLMMLLPFFVMLFLAKEPPDREEGHGFLDQIKCLVQPDGWMFNSVYIITFGGFLGLATYLPTFFHDQFGIDPAEAKYYTTFAVLMGSGVRVVGGYLGGQTRRHRRGFRGVDGDHRRVSGDQRGPLAGNHGGAAHLLLHGAGTGQRRIVPARAPALARHGGGRGQHDRRNRRAGRSDFAQCAGLLQATLRQLRGRVHRVRGALGGDPRGPAHRAALLGRQVDRPWRTRAFDHAGSRRTADPRWVPVCQTLI